VEFVIIFAVIAVVLVIPIMIGARLVGAKNTGFGSALLAVVIVAGLSALISATITDEIIAFVGTAVVSAFVLSAILGTTFFRGLAISVIATVIQVVVIVFFAGLLLGSGAAVG